MKRTIYIVDDDPAELALLTVQLERADFTTVAFSNGSEALEAIRSEPPDALISDLVMPDMSGIDLIAAVRLHYPLMPVIAVTAKLEEEAAEPAFSAGATDFFTKPVSHAELIARVHRAIEEGPVQELLRDSITQRFDGLVGSHPRVQEVRDFIRRVAAAGRVPSLLLGESGTGKNLVARALHNESDASRFRFVDVNCAALPDHLMEAELFGYEKGAFTGASKAKKGLVEAANEGTLLLDEVGTLSWELQAKLLTFLESKTFRRLGSTQDRQVDLRIVAATNLDLHAAVKAGQFREDLFYRLNVTQVMLPPLRETRSDIPELAQHFLRRAAAYFVKPVPEFAPESMPRLLEYDWPGNARELRNVIERAMIFLTDGGGLKIDPLGPGGSGSSLSAEGFLPMPKGLTLEEVERRYILDTLQETGGRSGTRRRENHSSVQIWNGRLRSERAFYEQGTPPVSEGTLLAIQGNPRSQACLEERSGKPPP